MQLATIALIFSILTPVGALGCFMIKAFTGRPAEELVHDMLRHPAPPPHKVPPPPHQETPPSYQASSYPYQTTSPSYQTPPPPPNTASPPPGYGRGYPPQYASRPAQPGMPGVYPQATRQSRHRWITHPWLFSMSLIGFVMVALYISSNPTNSSASPYLSLDVIGSLLYAGAWIASLVVSARKKQWRWFTALLLTVGYAVIFFSIFDRPKKAAPVSMMGTGGTPMRPAGI